MRKLIKWILAGCIGFKWYRRKIGGEWYLLKDPDSESGISGAFFFWVQELPKGEEDYQIVKTEKY